MRERGMLCFDSIERRMGPFRFIDGQTLDLPQLWLGDFLLANNLTAMDWSRGPVQFTICACGSPGCVGGDYFGLRRTGGMCLFLPAFDRWEDDFGIDEYVEPALKGGAVAGFMSEEKYEDLRAFETRIPEFWELQPLSYGEAIALWYCEAPSDVQAPEPRTTAHALAIGRDLSKRSGTEQIGFNRTAILCTSGEDDEMVLGLLRRVVATAHTSPQSPVDLIKIDAPEPVTVYLDVAGFVEWTALAKHNDRWHALLSPKLGVELSQDLGS